MSNTTRGIEQVIRQPKAAYDKLIKQPIITQYIELVQTRDEGDFSCKFPAEVPHAVRKELSDAVSACGVKIFEQPINIALVRPGCGGIVWADGTSTNGDEKLDPKKQKKKDAKEAKKRQKREAQQAQ
jgi:hypothetical protein